MTLKKKLDVRMATWGMGGILLILSLLAFLTGSRNSAIIGTSTGLGSLLLIIGLIFGRKPKKGEK